MTKSERASEKEGVCNQTTQNSNLVLFIEVSVHLFMIQQKANEK